jgi:hypothetical protein
MLHALIYTSGPKKNADMKRPNLTTRGRIKGLDHPIGGARKKICISGGQFFCVVQNLCKIDLHACTSLSATFNLPNSREGERECFLLTFYCFDCPVLLT